MRIALVTHQFFPSYYTGVERLTLNLANQLARMGHEAIVVTPAEQSSGEVSSYAYDGAWVRTVAAGDADLGQPWAQDPRVVESLVDVFREEGSEIVHVMHPLRLPQAFEAAERLKLPVVAHIADFYYLCARVNLLRPDGFRCPSAGKGWECVRACSIPSGDERYGWGKALLARAAAVVSPCRWTIERHASEGFDTTNWHHIPWGTDYAIHDTRLEPPPGDELVLGFIGTLLPHKGPHVLAEAVRLLPGRPIRLLLYGGSFHEEEYEQELRRIAGNDERIVFAGSYDHADLSAILAKLSAVVIPSTWYENLPTTGLNAIAARVPLIVPELGGMQELIDDYRCGFTYAADDPEALAALLAQLCDDRALLDDVRRTLVLPPSLEEEALTIEGIYTDFRRERAALGRLEAGVVVTKTFVWAHLPKAAGDMVTEVLSLFPEIIEYADPRQSRAKHADFSERADLVAGRQRVLSIRRLPAWQLSYSAHKSRHGLKPDYLPRPMDSPEEMVISGHGDEHLARFVEFGQVWPDRWIRVEHLLDDLLALLQEHDVKVTRRKLKKIRGLAPANVGTDYERSLGSWFTDEMISRMYEHNPLWQQAEHLAYGSSPQ